MHSTEATYRQPLITGLKEKLGDEYTILDEMSGLISATIPIRKQTDLIIVKSDRVFTDASGKLYCNENEILCIIETKDVNKNVIAGIPQFWKYYHRSSLSRCKYYISTNYKKAILINPLTFVKQENIESNDSATLDTVKDLGRHLADAFLSAKELKEIESEEIRQIISYNADEISTFIKNIDPGQLQKILDFFIFGFKDEESKEEESPVKDSDTEKKLLLTEGVGKNDFELYKYRVGAYVLISQIMFYSIFEKNDNEKTSPKHKLPSLANAGSLHDIKDDLDLIKHIDYGPIFGLDLLSELLKVSDSDFIEECYISLKNLADLLSIIDHSLIIKYDILGKLYHALIPLGLRKTLAAYYTKYTIARFILEFVIRDNNTGPVMDPTCGSGTFLISAYQKISELNPNLDHATILKNIFGNDITSFATLLATINLAFQDIEEATNRCYISRSDIFDLKNRAYTIDDYVKLQATETFSMENGVQKEEGYKIPKIRTIVGNPPFTKGDRLPQNYKKKLRGYFDSVGKKEYIHKNMPLHGYILLDLDRYLQKGGNFGLVLPITTLYIDKLEKTRLYLLENYKIECVITSEVEPFSEDTDQKEIILYATLAGNSSKKLDTGRRKKLSKTSKTKEPSNYDIKFVSLKRELTKNNYQTLAKGIMDNDVDVENEFFRINHIKMADLIANNNWSLCFNAKQKNDFYDKLAENPKIGRVISIENDNIRAFRGYRQLVTDYWMVPNVEWNLGKITPNSLEIINKTNPDSKITFQNDFFIPGITSSGDYDLPTIDEVKSYILKNDGGDVVKNPNLKKYITFVKTRVESDKFSDFLKQLLSIGKKFDYAGRIAFPHRFDLETGRIFCFLVQKRVGMGQNWFTIKGLNIDYENLLVAWFNSSLFIISFLISRRQQRGPFGQTAVGEFKRYLIPLPNAIPLGEIKKIFSNFQKFNKSALLSLTIKDQMDITLKEDNERRSLDLSLMEALEIFPHDEKKQIAWLKDLYKMISKEIELTKLQRKA